MNWWEWVFSGVGVLALGWIIEWLTRGWRSSGHDAAITAQGARVSDSPVASGSDIIQTVGGTHHHHYPPATATQPPAIESEPVPEPARPKPNIKIVGCKKILIHTGLDGAFYKSEEGRALGEAVVANVTNDARREAANIGAIIKAVIIYQNAGEELLRGMGCWLSEGSGMVQLRVDDSHSVVLGVVINGQFSVPTKRRVLNGIGDVSFPTDRNLLDFDRATVTVRLTNADTGDLYCEEQFEIAANPLSISTPQQSS